MMIASMASRYWTSGVIAKVIFFLLFGSVPDDWPWSVGLLFSVQRSGFIPCLNAFLCVGFLSINLAVTTCLCVTYVDCPYSVACTLDLAGLRFPSAEALLRKALRSGGGRGCLPSRL